MLFGADITADNPGKSTGKPAINFVSIDAAEVKRILPPAPAVGSLADKTDLETLLRVQSFRTPSDVALAERVAMTDFGVIWPGYANESYPKTAKLLGEVFSDLAMVLEAAKNLNQRPRPPKVHAAVKPCVIVPGSFSYPSGHSTVGLVLAGVFGAIVPEKKGDVMERAHLFAWARVIGGVHYPSDTMAGRLLGEEFVARMLKNPDFLANVSACRAELLASPVGGRSNP